MNKIEHSIMEDCVENILLSIKPSKNDNLNRVGAINELKSVIKSSSTLFNVKYSNFTLQDGHILGLPGTGTAGIVNPYGSYVSNLHSNFGDLDISVDGIKLTPCVTHGEQQDALRLVKVALENSGIAKNIEYIPEARVPVISYESKQYNVSCDVTIDNHLAQIKSKILNKINSLDSRFRDLVLLVKEWAKAQDINDPKNGSLNSYSISLLVIYHLQTCDPPILPPLCEIYTGNVHNHVAAGRMRDVPKYHMEQCIEKACDENIIKFKSQNKSRNSSSVSQLFLSFVNKFSSIETLCKDHKISTYNGQLKPIEMIFWSYRECYNLFIEDPFHHSENTARVVGFYDLRKISEAFKKTNNNLSSSEILCNRNYLLSILARPVLYSQLVAQYQTNNNMSRGEGSNRTHYPV